MCWESQGDLAFRTSKRIDARVAGTRRDQSLHPRSHGVSPRHPGALRVYSINAENSAWERDFKRIMKVNVLFFGITHDLTGFAQEQVEVPEGENLEGLRRRYESSFPAPGVGRRRTSPRGQ